MRAIAPEFNPSWTTSTNQVADLTAAETLAFPPLQPPLRNSHVQGGSGSLIVNSNSVEDASMEWVGAESLASFDVNVPIATGKPLNHSIICCTDTPAIQVGMMDRVIPISVVFLPFDGFEH